MNSTTLFLSNYVDMPTVRKQHLTDFVVVVDVQFLVRCAWAYHLNPIINCNFSRFARKNCRQFNGKLLFANRIQTLFSLFS